MFPNYFSEIYTCFKYFLVDLYTFVHQGQCAETQNVVGLNTAQGSIIDCRNECASRSNVEYFAYSKENRDDCACYIQCPGDNTQNHYNAYRIITPGTSHNPILGTNEF